MNDAQTHTKQLSLMLTPEQYKQIEAEASRTERSMGFVIRTAVHEYLSRIRRQPKTNKKEQK